MTSRGDDGMDRFTWGFILGAVALCVLAIGSVFLVRSKPPPPPGTPVAIVTAFVQAVRDRDSDRAWDLLAPDAAVGFVPAGPGADTTPRDAFRRQMAGMAQDSANARRIRILDSSEQGETARVTVEVTTAAGGPPLFDGGSSRTLTFGLKRVDGAWRIDTAPSLYEIG